MDYNDVRPQFKSIETEKNLEELTKLEKKQAFLQPKRIEQIAQYVLDNFKQKTHRFNAGNNGFNAMFAVSSVDAAKAYYQTFKQLQIAVKNPLKIATIFPLQPMKNKTPLVILRMKVLKWKRWILLPKNF